MLLIKSSKLKAPVFASLALAFASFGDAFLYPFLPVNNEAVGVPVLWVGALLSINRFVRIVANGWMLHFFSKYGLRSTIIVAVAFAISSTLGYAFAGSILVWLFLRICWGLSFSALRLGTMGYAIGQDRQGFALGLTKSLQEAGPMTALLITPILLHYLNPTAVFVVLSALSLPALYFAWNLPIADDKTPHDEQTFIKIPTTYNAITLLTAVLIDGIIIVVLGTLFLRDGSHLNVLSATMLAAFYLGYRRICLVVLAPLGGWISDKIGAQLVFNVTMIFIVLGLLMLVSGWIETGAITIFSFYSVNAAVTPGAVSQRSLHPLVAIAENATWRDLGAACGTLLGGVMLTSTHLNTTLIIAIFVLSALLVVHLGRNLKVRKLLLVWK